MKRFAFIKKTLIASLLLLISSNISAYDFEVDGIYYNIVSLENLTCAVTYGDEKYAGEVEIPATVTYNGRTLDVVEIGNSAFSNSGVQNVKIPNTITTIGSQAFYSCSVLTYISIPNSVKTIGSNVFWGCSELKRVVIEDGEDVLNWASSNQFDTILLQSAETVYIGRELSYGDYDDLFGKNLRDVTIGNSVTTITEMLFSGCTNLTNVTISNSVTSIGGSAFYNCTGLTNITIPNSITLIGRESFYGCTGLTNIIIPNSVTSIGRSAFYKCTGLTNINIPNSVTSIGDYAFYGCTGLLSVVIDDAQCGIGSEAFSNCSSLGNVSLGNYIRVIGDDAFRSCTKLKELTIPNTVTLIGSRAFSYCSTLESVSIGGNVAEIGSGAFVGCTNLKNLIINDGYRVLTLGVNGQYSGLFSSCPIETLYIGRGLSYDVPPFSNSNRGLVTVTIGNTVTKINDEFFSGQTNLAQISIGSSVSLIGSKAFYNCSSLFTIYSYNPIPSSGADNASFTNNQYLNAVVYVPKGSLAAYQAADGWKNFWNIYEMDTSTGVDNIQTPDNVVEVARYSIDGKRLSAPQKGINIVEMSDGSRQKVLVK